MDNAANNSSETRQSAGSQPGSSLPVTAEEAGLVLLVLLLWLVAIALFINRWGKIRMLEPYLPAYKMTPRAEALTVQVRDVTIGRKAQDADPTKQLSVSDGYQRRMSRYVETSNSSRMNSMDEDAMLCHYMMPSHSPSRPRQNSLMVPITSQLTAARKVKSAVDLVSLVIAEQREQRESLSGGVHQTNV
ncbi:uncharacterized protein LOC119110271 isoform X1 [Pollicipes pollicipes]|uniref:uncharacterized protein LOC119110271 isoform X1 n=1 Tax=Pollicipes pollicipes TaxID=41117 RepID=UPI0018857D3C|nr:uncharacterized protein LOC119110271 isoform X1 [Pollicipes pollicipes]